LVFEKKGVGEESGERGREVRGDGINPEGIVSADGFTKGEETKVLGSAWEKRNKQATTASEIYFCGATRVKCSQGGKGLNHPLCTVVTSKRRQTITSNTEENPKINERKKSKRWGGSIVQSYGGG